MQNSGHNSDHGTWEPAAIMGGIYGDGIIALKSALPPAFIQQMREDIETLFGEARAIPGGTLPRGPERYYVEIHPERLRGFVEIATHPWLVAVSEVVLGPEYRIVEVGFDVPGPGAQDQPWHRDFPAPDATTIGRRLNSLAFNITAVDTTEAMGPLEMAPGTQWDDLRGHPDPMFPPATLFPRYGALAQRRYPKIGDMSARSALTIHRGTANRSNQARPVLVVGVDAPDAGNAAHHDLQITRAFAETMPPKLLRHMTFRRVETLEPIVQAHTIDGLLKPAYQT
jgi:hypothetical protein